MNTNNLKYEILLIDDDETISSLVAESLECFEFKTTLAHNAAKAYEILNSKLPSLILLDLNMPEVSGHQVCFHIRNTLKLNIPILILSGNEDEAEVVKALEVGADDFIAKATSFEILLAHIRAVLRRANADKNKEHVNVVIWGPLKLDRIACGVFQDDKALNLTPTQLKMLEVFMLEPGVVFTRAQLIERLHGAGHHLTERTIDVHINAIRSELGIHRYALETVRNVGYRFAKTPL